MQPFALSEKKDGSESLKLLSEPVKYNPFKYGAFSISANDIMDLFQSSISQTTSTSSFSRTVGDDKFSARDGATLLIL